MAKTVYEYLTAEKESCERIARRYEHEMEIDGRSELIERHIQHYIDTAKALELAAQNLPVDVAEKEI